MQSYTHFTLEEREKLLEYLNAGKSYRKIGELLGRSASSISREIRRNRNRNGKYNPWRANSIAIGRSRRKRGFHRLSEDTALGQYVRNKLDLYWSPECIASCWNLSHPEDRVGFATIYRWLKQKMLPGYSRKTHLRRRGKKIQTRDANYNTIHPDRLIVDWPMSIQLRQEIGDWEGDTVYGGQGKGFLVTCVDRKTRFLAAAIVRSRRADETREAVLKALKDLPVKSLSLDNGSEFAEFRQLEKELDAPIYFAHPHAPWERGTNENMNGLLRFFFPKGCNFLELSEQYLQHVVCLINQRPRKCLGYRSPAELFFSCCT